MYNREENLLVKMTTKEVAFISDQHPTLTKVL